MDGPAGKEMVCRAAHRSAEDGQPRTQLLLQALIISGPVPKGDDQMFEEYQPLVEKLVDVQRKLATQLLSEAKQKISEGRAKNDQKLLDEGFLSLYRSHKSLPKNKPLIKYLSIGGLP